MPQESEESKGKSSPYLSGRRVLPPAVSEARSPTELIEQSFLAYNAARLREGCMLLSEKMLADDVTVGMSLAGALTPAGLGPSCVIPLIEAGFVDWIVSTGANLYHDLHFAMDLPMYAGSHRVDDTELREHQVVRIYDVLFDYDVLFATDKALRELFRGEEFQREMGTAELHHLIGRHADAWERKAGRQGVSVLAAAYRCGVPIYVSSPGDSAIGMNIAEVHMEGLGPHIDPSRDVNETAAIVFDAKRHGRSGVLLCGGGSPKNFVLQTEPQIQEVLGLDNNGHDYFFQVTDARPDTGGLSGATPHEAVSWGKVDPDLLPDAVVCYADTTIVLPLLANYALTKCESRKLKRLYDRRDGLMGELLKAFRAAGSSSQ
ncbi:MAG: homospermidine biosynthesis protein [Phycisphaerae bacterium]